MPEKPLPRSCKPVWLSGCLRPKSTGIALKFDRRTALNVGLCARVPLSGRTCGLRPSAVCSPYPLTVPGLFEHCLPLRCNSVQQRQERDEAADGMLRFSAQQLLRVVQSSSDRQKAAVGCSAVRAGPLAGVRWGSAAAPLGCEAALRARMPSVRLSSPLLFTRVCSPSLLRSSPRPQAQSTISRFVGY